MEAKNAKYLPWFLVLVCWLTLGVILAAHWRVETVSASSIRPPSLDHSLDIKIGRQLQLPATDLRGTRLLGPDVHKGLLLVYLGSGSECTAKSLRPSKISGRRFDRVAIVSPAPREELIKAFGAANCRLVADESGKLGRELNVLWSPRFYLLSAEGRLVDYQRDPTSIPPFVEKLR
jgi:hypothetical protein